MVKRLTVLRINHYDDVIMSAIAAHITSLTIVYSTVYPGADQSKHQSSASLAFVCGIHRGPVNSPHKWPVTRKMFPFDDVIMCWPFWVHQTQPPQKGRWAWSPRYQASSLLKVRLTTGHNVILNSSQTLLSRWGAVTAFLWEQRFYCKGNAQNKHPVRGTTALCEEQLSFQGDFLCTCEVILYKTLPIECPGISSIQRDVTFMLTSSRIWETVSTNFLQRRSCEVKLEY